MQMTAQARPTSATRPPVKKAKKASPPKSTRKGQNHPENPVLERIYEARRVNLGRIIKEQFNDNRRELGRVAQVHPNHISLCLTDNELHRRNVGEDMARKLESFLNLPEYSMDKPLSEGEDPAFHVRSVAVPKEVQRALHQCENLAEMTITPRLAARFDGRISGLSNLLLASPATNEMAPELNAGDKLIVDQGIKDYTGDGYYVLCAKGGSSFLRKVTKSLSGGFKLLAANEAHESLTVASLKDYKVWGRIVAVAGLHLLV